MYDITDLHSLIHRARTQARLTQRELANRIGTSQSAIAALERGDTNPTIDTISRCAHATGIRLRIQIEPLARPDPVIERYKRDVDRASLRENLRTSVDDRLRTLSEWQDAGRELQRATSEAKRGTPNRGTPNRGKRTP